MSDSPNESTQGLPFDTGDSNYQHFQSHPTRYPPIRPGQYRSPPPHHFSQYSQEPYFQSIPSQVARPFPSHAYPYPYYQNTLHQFISQSQVPATQPISNSPTPYTPGSESANTTLSKSKHSREFDEEHTSPFTKKSKGGRGSNSKNKMWFSYHDDVLIPFLANEVKKGLKPDKNFKKVTYVQAANAVNKVFGTTFNAENVEHHVKSLKTRYINMTKCKDISGNGWDASTCTATMESETLKEWETANPKLKGFINKPLKWFDELSIIVGDDFATGTYSRSVWEDAQSQPSSKPSNSEQDEEITVDLTGEEFERVEKVVKEKKVPTASASRRKSKHASSLIYKFEGIEKAVRDVSLAIEKATVGWGAVLSDKVREFSDKYSDTFLELVISTLYEDEKQGKVLSSSLFRVGRGGWKNLRRRMMWPLCPNGPVGELNRMSEELGWEIVNFVCNFNTMPGDLMG